MAFSALFSVVRRHFGHYDGRTCDDSTCDEKRKRFNFPPPKSLRFNQSFRRFYSFGRNEFLIFSHVFVICEHCFLSAILRQIHSCNQNRTVLSNIFMSIQHTPIPVLIRHLRRLSAAQIIWDKRTIDAIKLKWLCKTSFKSVEESEQKMEIEKLFRLSCLVCMCIFLQSSKWRTDFSVVFGWIFMPNILLAFTPTHSHSG